MDAHKPLYAIACERIIDARTVVPEIIHVHANDAAQAKFIFLQDAHHRKNYRIIAVGPVIGFHVEDEHGDVLRA